MNDHIGCRPAAERSTQRGSSSSLTAHPTYRVLEFIIMHGNFGNSYMHMYESRRTGEDVFHLSV